MILSMHRYTETTFPVGRVSKSNGLVAACFLVILTLAFLTGLAVPLAIADALVSNLVVVILAAVGATVVSLRWPVAPVAALLASTLLFNDQTLLTTGLPTLGLTIVDVLVLSLVPLVVIRVVSGGLATSSLRHDRIMPILLVLFALGSAQLIFGVIQEAQLRTALRDYRLFVYVPVVYGYVRLTISNPARRLALGMTWYVLVVMQFGAVVTGWLVLYDAPGSVTDLFPTAAYTSAWHFLGLQSFFPLLVSAAYLLGEVKLSRRDVILHVLVIAVWSLILLLSFNRTLWITLVVATGSLVCMSRSTALRRAVRPLAMFVAASVLVVVAMQAAGYAEILEALPQRAASTFDFRTDPSNLTRIADITWTAERVLYAPLGHGLGTGDLASAGFYYGDYRLGGAMHMGYLWLAYRAGILATMLFLIAIALPLSYTLRGPASAQSMEPWPRWHRAVVAALVAMAIGATAGTSMVSFVALPYWGLLLGLRCTPVHARRANRTGAVLFLAPVAAAAM